MNDSTLTLPEFAVPIYSLSETLLLLRQARRAVLDALTDWPEPLPEYGSLEWRNKGMCPPSWSLDAATQFIDPWRPWGQPLYAVAYFCQTEKLLADVMGDKSYLASSAKIVESCIDDAIAYSTGQIKQPIGYRPWPEVFRANHWLMRKPPQSWPSWEYNTDCGWMQTCATPGNALAFATGALWVLTDPRCDHPRREELIDWIGDNIMDPHLLSGVWSGGRGYVIRAMLGCLLLFRAGRTPSPLNDGTWHADWPDTWPRWHPYRGGWPDAEKVMTRTWRPGPIGYWHAALNLRDMLYHEPNGEPYAVAFGGETQRVLDRGDLDTHTGTWITPDGYYCPRAYPSYQPTMTREQWRQPEDIDHACRDALAVEVCRQLAPGFLSARVIAAVERTWPAWFTGTPESPIASRWWLTPDAPSAVGQMYPLHGGSWYGWTAAKPQLARLLTVLLTRTWADPSSPWACRVGADLATDGIGQRYSALAALAWTVQP